MTQLEFGFKNFRKYTRLNPLKLGEITYLVGENNSGKSTFIKGAMLMLNNLLKPNFNYVDYWFDFNASKDNKYAHINVPTFNSAINRYADDKEITFTCHLTHAQNAEYMDFLIETTVQGLDTNSSLGIITGMKITDNINCRKYTYTYDSPETSYKIESLTPSQDLIDRLSKLQGKIEQRLNNPNNKINPIDDTRNFYSYYWSSISSDHEQKYLESLKEGLNVAINKLKPKGENCPTTYNQYKMEYQTLPADLIKSFFEHKYELGLSDDLKSHKNLDDEITTLAHNLDESIKFYSSIEYLHIHEAEQRFFYNANDHNDETAQMIKEYHTHLGSFKDDIYANLVGELVEFFEITDKYIITEATEEGSYKVFLSKEWPLWDDQARCYINRQYWHPLATYGTGIIRIVFLVMNLVNLLFNHAGKNPIVIIEEPEMNLHPKYQSRLADLFRYFNKTYGFRFIIETHSEYIIRKTQVAVKQAGYQSMEEMDALNPYKVLYFPQDGDPYEMLYRTDGKFCNKFGPGFYDEANNLIFEIL